VPGDVQEDAMAAYVTATHFFGQNRTGADLFSGAYQHAIEKTN
jgi:hypothetical protein